MDQYIDGFVLPVPRARLDEYQAVLESVGAIWKEHGALEYREFVGDDLNRAGLRSFTDVVGTTEDEVIVFGWVVFPSRAVRDEVNAKVEKDPRMAELVNPLVDPENPVFDAARMAYGGFKPLL